MKREIDLVHGMTEVDALFEFARSSLNSPEARLLAGAKIEALWEISAEERRQRPTGVTLEKARAATAGLRSARWRSPTHFCSKLDVPAAPGQPGPVKRDIVLPNH